MLAVSAIHQCPVDQFISDFDTTLITDLDKEDAKKKAQKKAQEETAKLLEDGKPSNMEEYCEHIPSEVKKIQQRITQQKLEEKLTEDDKVINNVLKC